MNRITHDLLTGSDAWHKFRLTKFGASEAAAMLGLSATMKRSELLRMKHTGLPREFSDWLQAHVLDRGHEVEAMARPHAETFIGEDLFPVTRSMGQLSASCDGLTLDDAIAWEHKQWSESLADRMTVGIMPAEHMPQCQQVLLVTGAARLLFTVSDGTPERMLHLWVEPDPVWFQRLQQGWQQFEADLASYVLPDAAEPAAVGRAPETLPALRIEVTGAVTASNLAEFKETALATIRSVNRTLATDQDFADAEKAVKWCADVEGRVKAAKEHALSQTATIDALFKALDDISAEARTVRLDLDKLVTRRKVEVKEQAVTSARKVLDAHVATLNAELAPMRLQPVAVDFAGAIKGLRTVASLQDALDTTLAKAKIEADNQARGIRANVAAFKAQAEGMEFLFADLGQIVHKAADDFVAVLQARIATHRAAEAERERKRVEAAAAEAVRVAQQQAQAAQQAAAAPMPAPTPPPAAPTPLARPAAPAAPRSDEPATLNLGAICGRLGFTVSAQFVADTLGVQPARTEKASKLYTETQFVAICTQLRSHVAAMLELYAGEPA